jgi:hypothetical protein
MFELLCGMLYGSRGRFALLAHCICEGDSLAGTSRSKVYWNCRFFVGGLLSNKYPVMRLTTARTTKLKS